MKWITSVISVDPSLLVCQRDACFIFASAENLLDL